MLRLLEYIDAHLDEELTGPRLAAVVHLSPSRLAHLFTAQTGTPLRGYVEAQRMEAAARLLEMDPGPGRRSRGGSGSPIRCTSRATPGRCGGSARRPIGRGIGPAERLAAASLKTAPAIRLHRTKGHTSRANRWHASL